MNKKILFLMIGMILIFGIGIGAELIGQQLVYDEINDGSINGALWSVVGFVVGVLLDWLADLLLVSLCLGSGNYPNCI